MIGSVRLRTVVLALLALLVPLPALALNGDAPDPGAPVGIAVSVGLGDCGLAEAQIVCELDASWSAVEDADYYTVSVTRADGSVVDYGQSTGTAMSMWVPYVGAGSYSVRVSAWGTPEGEQKARVIARDRAFSTGSGDDAAMDAGGAEPGAAEGGHASAGEQPMGPGAEVPDDQAETPAEPPADPACEEPEPEPTPVPEPPADDASSGSPGETVAPETAAVSAETQAALEDQAELPDSVSCP